MLGIYEKFVSDVFENSSNNLLRGHLEIVLRVIQACLFEWKCSAAKTNNISESTVSR